MLNSDYLVIPWEWLESSLNDEELEQFYEFLDKASFDKYEDRYYIVSTKTPCANEVLEIIKNDGYKEPQKPVKLKKEELLKKLKELSELEDSEIAHIEAVEALLEYIDDDSITDAYSDVPMCF